MWRVDGKTAITRLAVDGPTPHKSLSDGLLSIVRRTGKDAHRSYATARAKRMKMDLGCFPQSHRLEEYGLGQRFPLEDGTTERSSNRAGAQGYVYARQGCFERSYS